MNQEHNNKTTITMNNNTIESRKKVAETTTRTQQLQKPWFVTVNKMSHMLCHSG